MDYYQNAVNFFVADCSKENAQKIKKILQVIPDSCTISVNSKYSSDSGCFGLYIFQCITPYEYDVDFVEQICKNFSCKLVYTSVDLRDLPW